MINAATFEKAILYAAKAHQGQFRKGDGRPYILHPISVMTRILSIKKSTNAYLLGTAAILHDVVEDCWKDKTDKEKLDEIAKEFGYAVASLVEELTLDKNMYKILGKTEYLCQHMLKMTSYALALKLCDRLDNVCDMKDMGEQFQKKYTEETMTIMTKLETRQLTKTHRKLMLMIDNELKPYITKFFGGARRTPINKKLPPPSRPLVPS